MRNSSIIIGNRYNDWTVLKRVPISESGNRLTLFLCKCLCGKIKSINSGSLIKGTSKSCGCRLRLRSWTSEENGMLTQKYFSESTENLLSIFPNRTYNGIKIQASKLNLNRSVQNRSGDASKLLLENPEAYYWAGFIAADGHIDKNERLMITLAIKDSEHLKKFAEFIETQNYSESLNRKYPNCYVSIQDPLLIGRFAEKFDFNSNKTTIPPNLVWLSGDLFISFLCGFIDGDGSIRKQTGRSDSVLTLKGHSSWIKNYLFFEKQVYIESKIEKYREKPTAHLNSDGYVELYFSDRKVLNFLKNKTVELNLPVLDRKWCKIDLSLPNSRYETAKHIKFKVRELKNKGLSQKEISQNLNISNGYVSKILSGRGNT